MREGSAGFVTSSTFNTRAATSSATGARMRTGDILKASNRATSAPSAADRTQPGASPVRAANGRSRRCDSGDFLNFAYFARDALRIRFWLPTGIAQGSSASRQSFDYAQDVASLRY